HRSRRAADGPAASETEWAAIAPGTAVAASRPRRAASLESVAIGRCAASAAIGRASRPANATDGPKRPRRGTTASAAVGPAPGKRESPTGPNGQQSPSRAIAAASPTAKLAAANSAIGPADAAASESDAQFAGTTDDATSRAGVSSGAAIDATSTAGT